ncbi:MAG: FAD-dependent oxidoreductase [Chitinophagaceae bacterium]
MISIWEREAFYAPQDIIIVGSGFVGLWSAFYLKKKHPKLKISIIERGLIPTGASSRNAGFACFGSLSEVVRDGQEMGINKMLALIEMRYKGLKKIQKYFNKNDIDFELCGGYELYDNTSSEEELQYQTEYINSLIKPITDVKKTYKLADEEISKFGFGNTKHLVKNNLEGYLHSGKLLQALIQKVQSLGVQIFTSVDVKNIERGDCQISLTTNHPMKFLTKQLLLCTNAFTKALVPEIDIVPARGQVLLTSPIHNLTWKGTFHSDEGYYYFRNLGNRVLLGGARNKAFMDEETHDIKTSDFIQQQLEQYLIEVVLPNNTAQYTIEHRWAGIMAMGSEKLPIIKELEPNIFCAVRMSGMGVALAPVVAQEVSVMMINSF